MIYELSSESQVLQWTCVPRKSLASLLGGYSERRERETQALCALVAEKTGLPLYDLSRQRD